MAWMHDNKGFFYGVFYNELIEKYIKHLHCSKLQAYLQQTGKADGSETKSSENQKLYYHQLGTDQSKDVVVVEFDDPHFRM